MHVVIGFAIIIGVIWAAVISSSFRVALLIFGILFGIFAVGQTWHGPVKEQNNYPNFRLY